MALPCPFWQVYVLYSQQYGTTPHRPGTAGFVCSSHLNPYAPQVVQPLEGTKHWMVDVPNTQTLKEAREARAGQLKEALRHIRVSPKEMARLPVRTEASDAVESVSAEGQVGLPATRQQRGRLSESVACARVFIVVAVNLHLGR